MPALTAAPPQMPVFRLIASTTWQTADPTPQRVFIALASGHVIETTSADARLALRQGEARQIFTGGGMRIEMRCLRCEGVAKGRSA